MSRASSSLFTTVALASILALPVQAAEPRDELIRLVPPNTAVCFIVQGLRDQAKAVSESPFAAWAADKLGPKITGTTELNTLKHFIKLIEDQIGIPLAELRDDILGDAIVLAYQPGPPGKPDAEYGAVMLHARDPAKLRKLIDRLNTLQKDRDEITEVKDVAYKQTSYSRRVKPDNKDEFYHIRDGLFVFSGQESAIKEIIDQSAVTSTASPIAESLKKLGVQSAFLTCWVNPRRLDDVLKADAAAAEDPGRKAFLLQFAKVWTALDGLAVTLDVRKDAELGLAVSFDPERLPTELRPLLASTPVRSAVWQVVPDNAMLALGGRIGVEALVNAIASFTPPDERPEVRAAIEKSIGSVVGKQNLPALLDAIGPDWGAWITPPAAEAKSWVPEWTAAVRLRDTNAGDARRSALKVVGFYVQMFQVDYNQKHDDQIEIRDETHEGTTISYLVNKKTFPPGFQPAYAVKDGFLVLAGSPNTVKRFVAPSKAESQTSEVPFLRISGKTVRVYLQEHKSELGKWLGMVQEKPADEVTKILGDVADLLEPVDRLELLIRGDDRRLALSLRLRLVKPLAK